MAILLFKLRGVPDDEADAIRAILAENRITYYETSAGNWGISLPAIWLRDESRLAEARALIEEYENRRLLEAQRDLAQAQQEGRQRTLMTRIKEEPVRMVLYFLIIAIILYFTTVPFIDFGDGRPAGP
ncbi:MAG TPA: hypothetical protein EYP40_11850 [Chromatiales bacterium]|nr:hypothetical protein [Chromatiales bacterium]